MKITKEDLYRSNSVNSMANCISFGDKFLACGMSQSVVLIDQTAHNARIIEQFDGHQSIVTAVSWVSQDLLVSADNSSQLIVWHIDASSGRLESHSSFKLASCPSPVVAVHGLVHNGHVYIACCGQSDLVLLTIDNDGSNWLEVARKSFQPNFILALHLVGVFDEHNSLLVATGLDNGTVVINCFNTVSWTSTLTTLVLSGHEDWVTSLDVFATSPVDFCLATSSQDNSVRLWRLSVRRHDDDTPTTVKGGTDWQTMPLGVCTDASDQEPARLRCQLDSVLAGGHENWVTRVRLTTVSTGNQQYLEMVSLSMDKTVIIWRCDDATGQWSERARLGQVGGNGLGFIGGDWTRDGSLIVGISYQGDMVAWTRDFNHDNSDEDSWHTVANVAGHFGPVEDLAWEPSRGRFLVTVSRDHSARLHGPWQRDSSDGSQGETSWHELGRPQLHGYEMTTVAMVTNTLMVSGADEKIARVFGMNERCHQGLLAVCGHDWLVGNGDGDNDWTGLRHERVARDALGLSARPDLVAQNNECDDGDDVTMHTTIPRHDAVAGVTLWPELAKLYGHAYEVWRVAAHSGTGLIASCCKAADYEHARVILWHRDTSSHGDGDAWTVKQRLASFHRSTVTRMQFSAHGDRLVTVSKDRQWALWQHQPDKTQWELIRHSSKAHQHAKVIWDVDWTPDNRCFATVSRDKKMMLWDAETGQLVGQALVFPDSVNAVSSMPSHGDDVVNHGNEHDYIFAVGLETGSISIVQFDRADLTWSVLLTFSAHHDWITRLQFAPVTRDAVSADGRRRCLLATCSRDRFVKIFSITVEPDQHRQQ